MNSRITVAIVEDDSQFREMLASILEREENLDLVGQYSSATEFVKYVFENQPDVVLMDVNLPVLTGPECVAQLKPQFPQIQFVMCTVYDGETSLYESLRSGATGYVLKSDPVPKIISAIKEVVNGGSPMSSGIARKVVNFFVGNLNASPENGLSKREKEVVELLAKGYRYKEIAGMLFISIDTVRTHIRNIYDKLHVSSRTEALNKLRGL